MTNSAENNHSFQPFAAQMSEAGLAPIVIDTFHYYYDQLVQGNTGMIGENELQAVPTLPDANNLQHFAEAGRQALARSVIIKLNGGLGTSMGLDKAKSLLKVKDGLSFLDIIARQVLDLRKESGSPVPLVLMNSFNTEQDSLQALSAYPDLSLAGLPLSFIQNKVPKVLQDGLAAITDPALAELAWCPPGHGDIYTALQTSGMLNQLLERGIEYAFVSNADNLGAVLDQAILGYFATQKLPFLMEVADRTEADSKGGHLAVRHDGRMVLREVAQCPPEALAAFSDITRYTYFNTNNIWLHLPTLRQTLAQNQNVLKLPLIRNSKTLDPRDPASPKVYQLETAFGAAIEIFQGAGALRVPRQRFAPVKLCSDLLVLWSDAYLLTPAHRVILNPANPHELPIVKLDNRHYKFIHQLNAHFPHGAPSLTNCRNLEIEGDIYFGNHIKVEGAVHLVNAQPEPLYLPDATILSTDTPTG